MFPPAQPLRRILKSAAVRGGSLCATMVPSASNVNAEPSWARTRSRSFILSDCSHKLRAASSFFATILHARSRRAWLHRLNRNGGQDGREDRTRDRRIAEHSQWLVYADRPG